MYIPLIMFSILLVLGIAALIYFAARMGKTEAWRWASAIKRR
jgi:hypothetical protein